MNIEPLQVKRGELDRFDFSRVMEPNRALTRYERTVQKEFIGDRAVLQAEALRGRDAMRLDGELADCLSSVFVETVSLICSREDDVTDPRVKQYAQEFHKHVIQECAGHQMGFYRMAAQQMAEQQSRPFSPPPAPVERPNLWQRVFGSGDG